MEHFLNSIGWLLSIVTAIGNGFVVLLVAKNHRLHSSANWLVLSLAGADFGVGIVVFPLSYSCHYSMECNSIIYTAFYWFFLHSSVTNLCVLTWDRYIAIVHPFKYNNSITERRPGMVIFIAWLLPFMISLSLLVGMYVTRSNTALNALRITGVSAFDIISCVLLLYAVVRILVVARSQSNELSAMELQVQPNHSSNDSIEATTSRRRERRNTVWFVIALVVFFLACYMVVNVLLLCFTLKSSCTLPENAGQIVTLLLVLNSAVNPLVYAFLKKDIKRDMIKLICREN